MKIDGVGDSIDPMKLTAPRNKVREEEIKRLWETLLLNKAVVNTVTPAIETVQQPAKTDVSMLVPSVQMYPRLHSCRYCGKELPFNSTSDICPDCMNQKRCVSCGNMLPDNSTDKLCPACMARFRRTLNV